MVTFFIFMLEAKAKRDIRDFQLSCETMFKKSDWQQSIFYLHILLSPLWSRNLLLGRTNKVIKERSRYGQSYMPLCYLDNKLRA